MRHLSTGVGLLVLVEACASAGARTTTASAPPPPAAAATAAGQDTAAAIGPQYPSTYQRHPNPPVLIRNATIMTAAGQEIQGGSILFKDGRIVAVGTSVQAPSDAVVVDGTGKWVTPGVIDTHSHIGVYAAPGTFAESDGNEATRPATAPRSSRRRPTAVAGTSGTRITRVIRRSATSGTSPSPRCCAATSM